MATPAVKFNRREFQEALHSALGSRTLEFIADYLEYLELEGTPDQKMKFIQWAVPTLGGEAEKQQSASQYATVTVNIGVGGQVTVDAQAKPVETLRDVREALELSPTALMASSKANADLVDLLGDAC